MASDTLHKNHFAGKNDEDYLLEPDELYKIQLQKYEKVPTIDDDGKKSTRIKKVVCNLNMGKKQYMEFVEKYGLSKKISESWQIWDTDKKQYVPFE